MRHLVASISKWLRRGRTHRGEPRGLGIDLAPSVCCITRDRDRRR